MKDEDQEKKTQAENGVQGRAAGQVSEGQKTETGQAGLVSTE